MSQKPLSVPSVDAIEDAEARLLARRESLRRIGRFAAVTAPAMLVLLDPALAAAASEEPAADDGWQKGNYNEHTRRHSHG